MWYRVKVLRIRYNLFAGTETLSLSVYEPITIPILLGEDSPPILGRGGRVCYTLKVLCSSYNLFAGTYTLSLSVYKPIAKQILVGGPCGVVLDPQIGGRCGARGSKMVPF